LADLGWGGTWADGVRAFGAEGVHRPELLFEDITRAEKQGGAGRREPPPKGPQPQNRAGLWRGQDSQAWVRAARG